MNCTSKSQTHCQLTPLTSIWLVTFNHVIRPFLFIAMQQPQATRLHGNPSRSVPWEREWAGLTSVWPFTCGQCQHANMAHSILPYGAIAYVLLAQTLDQGPFTSCCCERDRSTLEPAQWLIHMQNGLGAHLTARQLIPLSVSALDLFHGILTWNCRNSAQIDTPVSSLLLNIKMSAVQPAHCLPVGRNVFSCYWENPCLF